MNGARPALTSDHVPEAIPDIVAACSRGNAYEPTFIASIWNMPPMKQAHDIIAMAIGTDSKPAVNPNGSASTVSSANMPTGRLSLVANLSAAHPPTKYPRPQNAGGIQKIEARSACATPSPRCRYVGIRLRMGPGAMAGSA